MLSNVTWPCLVTARAHIVYILGVKSADGWEYGIPSGKTWDPGAPPLDNCLKVIPKTNFKRSGGLNFLKFQIGFMAIIKHALNKL